MVHFHPFSIARLDYRSVTDQSFDVEHQNSPVAKFHPRSPALSEARKNPYDFPLYWLVYRDPYIGF